MGNMTSEFRALAAKHLDTGASTIQSTSAECLEDILAAAGVLVQALKEGHKILFCGNGGSAADAQHLAAELMGRFKSDRRPLPAVALTTDTSFLTSWSNDVNFESIFARQVEGLGQPGDVLVAISTSGNSLNVIRAVEQARKMKLSIIILTGSTAGRLIQKIQSGDILIRIPSSDTQHIQEGHISVGHVLCLLVEKSLVGIKF